MRLIGSILLKDCTKQSSAQVSHKSQENNEMDFNTFVVWKKNDES
jgi:hypothetical protein